MIIANLKNTKWKRKEKWDYTDAYKEHEEKTKNYSKDTWNNLSEEMNDIFAEFAVYMKKGEEPNSDKTQNLVKRLQEHITENYYHCTNEFVTKQLKSIAANKFLMASLYIHISQGKQCETF